MLRHKLNRKKLNRKKKQTMTSMQELLKQKAQQIKDDNISRTRTHKWAQGDTYFTILPIHGKLNGAFWRDYGMHYIKDAKGNLKIAVPDATICAGESICPVREGILELMNMAYAAGDKTAHEHFKKSLASARPLFNIQILKPNDTTRSYDLDGDPVMAELSAQTFESLLSLITEQIIDEDDKLLRWNDRLVFKMTRSGTTVTDTKYILAVPARKMTLNPNIMDKAMNVEDFIHSKFVDVPKALGWIEFFKGGSADAAMEVATTTPSKSTRAITAPEIATVDDDVVDASFEVRDDSPPAIKAAASSATFLDDL